MHPPRRSRALPAALLLIAACGSSEPATDQEAAPPTSASTPASAPATTGAAPVATTPPTAPATTAAPPSTAPSIAGFPELAGTWNLIERVTSDDGYFGGGEVEEVFAFPVEFSCDDASCTAGIYGTEQPPETTGTTPAVPMVPATFDFDGTTLTLVETSSLPCLDPATQQFDGPAESVVERRMQLVADVSSGTLVGWSGAGDVVETTAASERCAESRTGYTVEAVLHRETPTFAIDRDFAFSGVGSDGSAIARGVRVCTTDTCEALMRVGVNQFNDPTGELVFIDFALTTGPDGAYTATSTYPGSCLSDLDGSFVSPDAYDVQHTVTVKLNWVGGIPVLLTDETLAGVPSDRATPEQAAVCAPYEQTRTFLGTAVDDPSALRLDWVPEAISTPA